MGKVAQVAGLSAEVLAADDPLLSKAKFLRAAREVEGDRAGPEASSSSVSEELRVRLALFGGATGCFPLAAAFPLAIAAPCFSVAPATLRFATLVTAPCSPEAGAVSASSKLRCISSTSLCV